MLTCVKGNDAVSKSMPEDGMEHVGDSIVHSMGLNVDDGLS